MNILTSDFLPYMESHLLFMEENKTDESVGGGYGNGFDQLEIAKFKRVVDYMRNKIENPDEEYVKKGRAIFIVSLPNMINVETKTFMLHFQSIMNLWNYVKMSIKNNKKIKDHQEN